MRLEELVLIGTVVLLIGLLIPSTLVGAAQPPAVEDAFPLTDDEIEIAALKIDLLESAALTLQWKRQALIRDRGLLLQNDQLLAQEDTAWLGWQADLQEELTALFDCAYDLGARACAEESADEPTLDEEPDR